MLDNVRRTVADSLRMLTAIDVGDQLPPVKIAKKLASVVAERLYPAEAPRDWRANAAATSAGSADVGSGWAGHASATNTDSDAGGLASQAAAQATAAAVPQMDLDAGQLRSEMDGGKEYILVDVRDPPETLQGIIPGARLIPMSSVLERIGELRHQDRPLVIYCASGSRSKIAAQHLRDRGVALAYNLKGGIDSWLSNGGETTPPESAA